MACLEHHCNQCGHDWFDNNPSRHCPMCGSMATSQVFDEQLIPPPEDDDGNDTTE